MRCNICDRGLTVHRKGVCPSCARAVLYPGRVEQVAALLDREKWHAHVEAVVRPGNDGVLAALPEDADWDAITAAIKTHGYERMKPEIQRAEEQITIVTRKAQVLRKQVEEQRGVLQKLRESNERRKRELAEEKVELEKQRAHARDSLRSAVTKTKARLERIHKRIADARGCLCHEAASLSGLKKVKRENGKSEYRIAGLPLLDLRDLNGISSRVKVEYVETFSGSKPVAEPYEMVSTALDHASRLVGICCNYLGIRVPAEMILPHSDFPHAAILPRDSSYRGKEIRYPVLASSRANSPMTSRVLERKDLPRPRVLRLDRALSRLQKEDAKSALLFLEGVVLFAYDLAWLCRAQGMDHIDSFGDVCAIGSNLYRLFYRQESRPVLRRNVSSATTTTTETAGQLTLDAKPRFGTHSHQTSKNSLASHEGLALFAPDAWPITIHRLTDQLKAYLRQETARAEWDFIDKNEWDEDREEERPVLVGGTLMPGGMKDPAMSVLSIKPSDDVNEGQLPTRELGGRGWMKVRGRGGDG